MTQVHFTLKSEEIQSIIEYSVKDDVSKNILTTVFNQLMENQRCLVFCPADSDRIMALILLTNRIIRSVFFHRKIH